MRRKLTRKLILSSDYKVYKKSSKTLRICGFAQIFCLHFNEESVLRFERKFYEQI